MKKVLLLSQIATVDYKYTFSLANALQKQGNYVEVIIDQKNDCSYCQCKVNKVFYNTDKSVGRTEKLKKYREAYQFILNKVIKEKFDVVHIQWTTISPIDYIYLRKIKKAGAKIIASVHDILPFNCHFYDKYFHRKIYGLCDKLIVQAQTNIKRFDEVFPEYKSKVIFIPHGHFLDFANVLDKNSSRAKLSIPTNKVVFLFFGQIKKVKGVDILLEAFGSAVKKNPNIYLIIAGKVWKNNFEHYQQIIDKFSLNSDNLRTDIKFIPDEDVDIYYSASDIAVLPYTDVYQSGVIQLAYAYGKPVIASSIAPFMEIVKDGVTGYLFQNKDVSSLEHKILEAADDSKKWMQLGESGKVYIRKKYSWDDIAAQITEQCYVE